ncbi:hypothetical protein [Parendozoicomonas haliclonae]|uniref:Uncharacterized protein n=1 Tax=Parendozoicomonas haliclonae TaxID=1960125 RepID=A0A1X7AE91_9GAMM|nr:hypothetical protein [Parendozoicomonas haliclonae]SMA32526.1 hypothetical protein EHSB41UT_00159 [Parendozoicomonas haliclonae]
MPMDPQKPSQPGSVSTQPLTAPETHDTEHKNTPKAEEKKYLPEPDADRHSQAARSLQDFKVTAQPVKTSRIKALSNWAYKQLVTIRSAIIGVIPTGLKNAAQDMKNLTSSREFGTRYPQGIPDSELKHFHTPRIVVLSGMSVNPLYHALLCFGDPLSDDARFIQINDTNAHPEVMNRDQFVEFLKAEGGDVKFVYQPKPTEQSEDPKTKEASGKYLQRVTGRKWRWMPHSNCLTFCTRYLKQAGYDTKQLKAAIDVPRLHIVERQNQAKQKNMANLRNKFSQLPPEQRTISAPIIPPQNSAAAANKPEPPDA